MRALQENKITRVGGDKDIIVNVRVLAATNKDLSKEVAEHRFRLDLFHRLNVIPIHVPTLNERNGDIALLAKYFIEEISSDNNAKPKPITEDALKELQNVNWTGNVRELRNIMERLFILCGTEITRTDILTFANSGSKRETEGQMNGNLFDHFKTLQEFKDHAEKCLWNTNYTRMVGISLRLLMLLIFSEAIFTIKLKSMDLKRRRLIASI